MSELSTVQTDFKDRHVGLVIFGIINILIGCLNALAVPLMLLGQMFAGRVAGTEPLPLRFMIPNLLIYGFLAVIFVWLGIGSIMCRRWARALLLILAWSWLLVGTITTISMAFVLPQILAHQHSAGAPQLSGAVRSIAIGVGLLVNAVIFILIPGVMVFFYQSPHVEATCADRDPVRRWTDACPLPLLGLSVLLGYSAITMPFLAMFYNSPVPLFGCYISGAPGAVIMWALAAVYGYAAWACFKTKIAGWWTALIAMGISTLSSSITFATVGILPMYEMMGYPQTHLERLKQMGFLNNPSMWILMSVGWLLFMGFVIYVKKYFKQEEGSAPALEG